MPPQLRFAEVPDAPLLLRFMREYYAFDGHTFVEDKARTALVNFLKEPAYGRAWIIFDEESPVGYIVLTFGYSLEYQGRDAFIDEFFLLESHRFRGWGRLTMQHVEEFARANGVRCIHLEVTRPNHVARAAYRKWGFVDHEHSLMSKKIASE
jgi:GNAT superfamily N-acetyltransferase